MPIISTRGAATARGFGMFSKAVPFVFPNIGDPFQGGFYAGIMASPDVNYGYALIVSPKAQGQAQRVFDGVAGPSRWDGKANTDQGANNSVYAFTRALTIGGFTDWYVPAIDELELLYRNLKPTTTLNVTGNVPPNTGTLITNPNGTNPNSLPLGAAYTTTSPAQTTLPLFQVGGDECLDSTANPVATWSSTTQAGNPQFTYFQRHNAGEENVAAGIGNSLTVRAVRRYILPFLPESPPAIGDFYQGGYYAGDIAVGADIYRIIMAPKETGEVDRMFGAGQALVASTSINDGILNKTYFQQSGVDSPAINWANSLTINGFNDWYIGARDENELLYRNFKPTTTTNLVANRVNATGETGAFGNGLNTSSVPNGLAYTTNNPLQTPLTLFQKGGTQAIKEDGNFNILGCTTFSGNTVLSQDMTTGQQLNAGTGLTQTIRAIRRVKIT